ncbi:MAG: GNAT family N-acetyltransferase [Minicystis sp.]
MSIRVEAIERVPDLSGIRGAWIELWERCPRATPFQRPEWLIPWCRRFAPEVVRVTVVRAEGRVIGMLPLGMVEGTARLLGEGITDYLDALIDPAHEEDVLEIFAEEIERWDRAELSALPEWSPLLQVLPPTPARDAAAPCDACPVLSIEAGLEKALPREMTRNLHRARVKAEARGQVDFVMAHEENRAALLEALFALHEARWEGRGALGDEAVRAFHREMSAEMLAAGMLRLGAMTLGGRVVAVVYGLAGKDVLYLYLQGYEPALADVSPGTLVLGYIMAEAERQGARAIDMLRGQEAYKYRFGAKDRMTWRRAIRRG